MATVSVLIPAYNASAYIRQAVTSALNQRDVDVEVLVIDDGSTDDTPKILEEFGDSIRVLRQKNAGHVKARNNGSRLARGEWLAFLDADDEWLPDKLAKQLARADEKTSVVYTDRVNFGDIGRVAERQSNGQRLWEGDIFERLLLVGNFITVSSVIIRKSVFERLGGFEEELLVCEDWDLWLRYTAQGGLIGLCPEGLTRYRWHAGAMTNNLERMLHGRLKVVQRALALPRGQLLTRSVVRRALAREWEISAWYAAKVHRKKALAWYLQAARHWPWNLSTYKAMLKCLLGRG
jgi:glycosyltransferase involved in cell wall biosynthesis